MSHVDEIERTRSYRAPPSKTSSSTSYELIKAVQRPNHGTKGELINLLVNWFKIKFNRSRIYVYTVIAREVPQQKPFRGKRVQELPPPISHSGTLSKIFWTMVRSYKDFFPNPHGIIFDDYEFIFAHIDSNTNVQWTSIFLKCLLSQNSRYVPSNDADPQEIEISNRFAHFNGGMFFVPRTPKAPKVVVQPGVESWLGLYASVRRMENFDPVINFGLVNKLFIQMNLDLITFYLAIENDSMSVKLQELKLNRSSTMLPEQAAMFTSKLKDIKLKCDCAPGKDKDGIVTGRVERHYKLVELKPTWFADRVSLDVEDSQAPEIALKVKTKAGMRTIRRRCRSVRMDEWYAAQGKPLNYPKLPLCSVKSGKREDLIPMEVLFTHDQPQKYIKLLNFYARMRITKLLARPPEQHHKFTNKMIMEKLEYEKDPFMEAMKISLDSKMIECEGRRMEPCDVLGKSESDESLVKLEVKKESGDFFLSRAMETSTKKIRFVVYKLTDAIDESEIREFYRQLVKKCVTRGFNVPVVDHQNPPIYKKERIGRYDDIKIAQMMADDLALFDQSGKSDDELLVFLFFTKMVDELYGQIKYHCDILHGVVSQVVDEGTVKKACKTLQDEMPSDYKSVYHHLCLKLNAKLGGINQIVSESELDEGDEPEYGRMPSNERTMFIGIDVIHPSPNSPIRDLSLGAIVASMDKNAAKYAVRIKVNSRCNENVQHFDEHFSLLLAKYISINNFLPERIVILRDGVSDSEMVKAASQELNSIKLAWRKCANGKKCPPFTYIVVQKNHKTRFYRQPNNENGQVKNPPMGTVVDKDVVTPHMFDFYMVSHYTQLGTTRPIHYTVVYDDCESSADVVQEMIFRMCFLYARCSKPVSLPSPVYYAHLACERAAFQHQYAIKIGEVHEIMDKKESESDDDYASRVERQALIIEGKLQKRLENSLDSGAAEITVTIKEGGMTLLQKRTMARPSSTAIFL
ncbi:rde-1 [Pristionchus pacificus]|uniref:Rde-1 n=1 Tax=Pristionchus pacificus TaxID=54126 RepID=A0A2A6CRV1_PRIPA|nr:rde-1 [Pristionchus pacificus]|eukprot:PDM80850.1 rde-1 [Pristionchus pacificus]